MKLSFSQRMGASPAEIPLLLGTITIDLRNAIWNFFFVEVFKPSLQYNSQISALGTWIYRDFFNRPVDEFRQPEDLQNGVRYWIQYREWYQVYDFVEFLSTIDTMKYGKSTHFIHDDINQILEKHSSGYRFINKILSPISNSTEISEIEKSIIQTSKFSALIGCNVHLTAALKKLSDREYPDYRNSIKESISAIESIAKAISGKDESGLTSALKPIKEPLGLNQVLIEGFIKLYGYTSTEGGIRHAMMEASTCDFDDAKYMLVSCSAFVNYLIPKCAKAGIALS